MNILFSCGDFYPNLGGAVSLVDDLAREFLKGGNSVVVLTRKQPGTTALQTFHGYDIHRFDYPLPYEKFERSRGFWTQSLRVTGKIWRLLRQRSITTVCIGLLDMSAWYLFLLHEFLPFRLVLYLHGGDTLKLPATEPTYARLLCTGLRVADEVIAVSRELRVEAAKYWPGVIGKTHVIFNAIDLQSIRTARPFKHPRPYIAAVGRLTSEKDFGTLIRAYAKVQLEIADVDLVIAGKGNLNTAFQREANACAHPSQVVFLGRVEREIALSVMKGAMFVVLPSVTEGFPIVAVEAVALGKPLIGTTIPGIAAIVEDGLHGNLFPPGDIDALASLLRLYCHDDEHLRKVSEGAASVDLAPYDIAKVAEKHLRVFAGME
jgi:1,4-alpha-glucan branching enzyme